MVFTQYLEALLTKAVTDDGTPVTRRKTLDFSGTGVSVSDDAPNRRTKVVITAGGTSDHGVLTGLLDHDHTIYGLLTGAVATGTWTWTAGDVDVQAGTVTATNVRRGSGNPDTVVSGNLGDWFTDTATGNWYQNDDGATSWVLIGSVTPLTLGTNDPVATGGAPDDGVGTTAAKIDHNHDRGTKGSNIPSATTLDLAAATGDYAHVTGTTTITGLGTADSGIERELVFDGVLTLTHNATTLDLPGDANITTAAGDTASFRSEGSGNWKCTKYTRADGSSIGFASTTEVLTGTETAKAVTPNANAALWEHNTTDITDGATITIGEGGSFDLVTSTTAITAFSFTTSRAGRRVVCRFDTARTLTHNATSLILPEGENIRTTQGDVCEIEDLGSGNARVNWYTKSGGSFINEGIVDGTGSQLAIVNLAPANFPGGSLADDESLTFELFISRRGTGTGYELGERLYRVGVTMGRDEGDNPELHVYRPGAIFDYTAGDTGASDSENDTALTLLSLSGSDGTSDPATDEPRCSALISGGNFVINCDAIASDEMVYFLLRPIVRINPTTKVVQRFPYPGAAINDFS